MEETKSHADIDLTYICKNRIIVMSYPADGLASNWRNRWQDVAKFLNEKHQNRYWIFNVSERNYDKSRFEGRVSNFNWADHHAPPFHLLTELVDEMYKWLKAHPENVVAMHCNSGKGRAGTACTCLLMYTGFFDSIKECAKMFGSRRFLDDKGVS